MTNDMCADGFHRGESDGIEYALDYGGGLTGYGYECPTCGFRTVTVEDDPEVIPRA